MRDEGGEKVISFLFYHREHRGHKGEKENIKGWF